MLLSLSSSFLRKLLANKIVRLLYFTDLHSGYKQIGTFRFFIVVSLHRQTGMTALFDLLLHTEKNRKAGSQSAGHNLQFAICVFARVNFVQTNLCLFLKQLTDY